MERMMDEQVRVALGVELLQARAELERKDAELAQLRQERDELAGRYEAAKDWHRDNASAVADFSAISKALATQPPLPLPESRTAGGVVVVTTLREQAAMIGALADALELLRKTAHDDVRRAEFLPIVDAVLRRAGRNP